MPSLFVVAGHNTTDDGPSIYTSLTGETWTERVVGSGHPIVGVLGGGPLAVAGLESSYLGFQTLTSDTAEVWALTNAGLADAAWLGHPGIWGNDRYVTANSFDSYTSTDGETWSKHASAFSGLGGNYKAIAYGDDKFVIAGTGAGGLDDSAYSADGETWTGLDTGRARSCIARGASRFVMPSGTNPFAEGDATTTLTITSPDGVTWSACDSFNGQWEQVAWSGSLFCAVGIGAEAGTPNRYFPITMTSPDGLDWTYHGEQTMDLPRSSGEHTELVGGKGRFVYVPRGRFSTSSDQNEIWYSTDGASWTSAGTFADREFNSVCFHQPQSVLRPTLGWKVGMI